MGNNIIITDIGCRCCKHITKHTVKATVKYSWIKRFEKEDYKIIYYNEYQIVQCNGCEAISFREIAKNTEDIDPDTGELEENYWQYPEIKYDRDVIEGYKYFPREIAPIYNETLRALNENLHLLCAIGIRTLIESICVNQGIKARNLEKKIDQLTLKGLISEKQKEFMHELRFLGNYAAHQITAPNIEVLKEAFDIAETILKIIYILPKKFDRIKH